MFFFHIVSGATAFHAVELGYRTVLVDDACRGITLEDIHATKQKLNENNGIVVHSDQVKSGN